MLGGSCVRSNPLLRIWPRQIWNGKEEDGSLESWWAGWRGAIRMGRRLGYVGGSAVVFNLDSFGSQHRDGGAWLWVVFPDSYIWRFGDSDTKGEGRVVGRQELPSLGGFCSFYHRQVNVEEVFSQRCNQSFKRLMGISGIGSWVAFQLSFLLSGWVVYGPKGGLEVWCFHYGQAELRQRREGSPRRSCSPVLGDRTWQGSSFIAWSTKEFEFWSYSRFEVTYSQYRSGSVSFVFFCSVCWTVVLPKSQPDYQWDILVAQLES